CQAPFLEHPSHVANVVVVHMPVPHQLQAVETLDLFRQVEHLGHGLASSTVAAEAVAIGAVSERRQAGTKRMVRNHDTLLARFTFRSSRRLQSWPPPSFWCACSRLHHFMLYRARTLHRWASDSAPLTWLVVCN